jgi:hypothetical protein
MKMSEEELKKLYDNIHYTIFTLFKKASDEAEAKGIPLLHFLIASLVFAELVSLFLIENLSYENLEKVVKIVNAFSSEMEQKFFKRKV